MQIKLIQILFLLLSSAIVFGQSSKSRPNNSDAIYVELGGNGLFYSINYEKTKRHFGLRFGYGVAGLYLGSSRDIFIIPCELIYVSGKHKSKLETGIGFTFVNRNDKPLNEYYGAVRIGYRFQGTNDFLFKIGFITLYFFPEQNNSVDKNVWPYGGISFGKIF